MSYTDIFVVPVPKMNIDRYRQQAIADMRNLGDRRATAELMLSDTPTRAIVVNARLNDVMQLMKRSFPSSAQRTAMG